MRSRNLIAALALLCAAAGVWAKWFRAKPTVQSAAHLSLGHLPSGVPQSELNVLFITLDTTRADRMGAYGYAGIETPPRPHRREGVLFEQAALGRPADAAGALIAVHRQVLARARRARQRRILPRTTRERRWRKC